MKMIKYYSCLTMIALLLASCAKENFMETTDEIPPLEPTIKDIDASFLLRRLQFQADTASIGATQAWQQNQLDGYNLQLQPSLAGEQDITFNLHWLVNGDNPEFNLEEKTYLADLAYTLSPDKIDAFETWVANGAEPASRPDPLSGLEEYNASGVTVVVSDVVLEVDKKTIIMDDPNNPGQTDEVNIIMDEANISISGSIRNPMGKEIPIAGSFFATLVRAQY